MQKRARSKKRLLDQVRNMQQEERAESGSPQGPPAFARDLSEAPEEASNYTMQLHDDAKDLISAGHGSEPHAKQTLEQCGQPSHITNFELEAETDVAVAVQQLRKTAELRSALGEHKIVRQRMKTTTTINFEVRDLGMACINRTTKEFGSSRWTVLDAGRFNTSESFLGKKRYIGFSAVKLREIKIISYRGAKHTFKQGQRHSSETPTNDEMDQHITRMLGLCTFAFTQSRAGHVLDFFFSADPKSLCYKVKESIAQMFESYYLPNGMKQYKVDTSEYGRKDIYKVDTDHYFDGSLASVCRTSTSGVETEWKPGEPKFSPVVGSASTECCQTYSMKGSLRRASCTIEQQAGAVSAHQILKQNQTTERSPTPDGDVFLQEDTASDKFKWKDVLGAYGASMKSAHEKKAPEAETAPVMGGTARYTLRQLEEELNDTPSLLESRSDVFLSLASTWGHNKVDVVKSGTKASPNGVLTPKFSSDDVQAAVDNQGHQPLKEMFVQDPATTVHVQRLVGTVWDPRTEHVVNALASVADNVPLAQDVLVALLGRPQLTAHVAQAMHPISQPRPQMLLALDKCAFDGGTEAGIKCACMLSLGTMAHSLFQQGTDTARASQIASKIGASVISSSETDSCELASLFNAGPAGSTLGGDLIRMIADAGPKKAQQLLQVLQYNLHQGVDAFLLAQALKQTDINTKLSFAQMLARRKSGSLGEAAINQLGDHIATFSHDMDNNQLRQLHQMFLDRSVQFHSPAAENVLRNTGVLLQEDETTTTGFSELDGYAPALKEEEEDAKIARKELEKKVDTKYKASLYRKLRREMQPKLRQKLKEQLEMELTRKLRSKLAVRMRPEYDKKFEDQWLEFVLKHGAALGAEEKLEQRERMKMEIDNQFQKELTQTLKKEIEFQVDGQMKRDFPSYLDHQVNKELRKLYGKASEDKLPEDQEASEDEEKVKKKVQPFGSLLTLSKCTTYDTSREFSCERGIRRCFDLQGEEDGCVGASYYATSHWSQLSKYSAETQSGIQVDVNGWSGTLVDSKTTSKYRGTVGDEFFVDGFLRYYNFGTMSYNYVYRKAHRVRAEGPGDSCRGFQIPGWLQHSNRTINFFGVQECVGIPLIASLCGSLELSGKVSADYGGGVVKPGHDSIVAYTKLSGHIGFEMKLTGNSVAFATYSNAYLNLISIDAPTSSVFAFTKMNGGYSSQMGARFLEGIVETGVKGPGLLQQQPKLVSEFKSVQELEKSVGSKRACVMCTDWAGPDVLEKWPGAEFKGLLGQHNIKGPCGPDGKLPEERGPNIPQRFGVFEIHNQVNEYDALGPTFGTTDIVQKAKEALRQISQELGETRKKLRRAQVDLYKVEARERHAMTEKSRTRQLHIKMKQVETKVKRKLRNVSKKYARDEEKGMGFLSKAEYEATQLEEAAQVAAMKKMTTKMKLDTAKLEEVREERRGQEKEVGRFRAKVKTLMHKEEISKSELALAKYNKSVKQGIGGIAKPKGLGAMSAPAPKDPLELQLEALQATKQVREWNHKLEMEKTQRDRAVKLQQTIQDKIQQEQYQKSLKKREEDQTRQLKGQGVDSEFVWNKQPKKKTEAPVHIEELHKQTIQANKAIADSHHVTEMEIRTMKQKVRNQVQKQEESAIYARKRYQKRQIRHHKDIKI